MELPITKQFERELLLEEDKCLKRIKAIRLILPYRKNNIPDNQIVRDVVIIICDTYGVTLEQLKSKSRRGVFVAPRQLAMYLIEDRTKLSLQSVGAIFSRAHGTVIHARKIIRQLIEVDMAFKQEVSTIEIKIDIKQITN